MYSLLFLPSFFSYLAHLVTGQLGLWNRAALSASFVYNASGHIVDASEFICGIYIGVLPRITHVSKLCTFHIYGI